ncbi:MAG: hypothetical protein FWF99_07815, partial [Desulfovibrionaceae bacterium]|nr:hypothetical protein [Desulfovibrionaceae bacterium]
YGAEHQGHGRKQNEKFFHRLTFLLGMFETGAAQRMREQRPRGKLSDKFIYAPPAPGAKARG